MQKDSKTDTADAEEGADQVVFLGCRARRCPLGFDLAGILLELPEGALYLSQPHSRKGKPGQTLGRKGAGPRQADPHKTAALPRNAGVSAVSVW